MPFIASRLTCGQTYTGYQSSNDGVNTPTYAIHVNGGNGLVNRALITLEGAITEVTNEQLELLKSNPMFQGHMKNGFIKITDQQDAAKAVSDLESRDESAPMTPADIDNLFESGEIKEPIDYINPAESKRKRRME